MPEGTLILAEDDSVLRQLYTNTLRATGYTVLAVSNGREALDLIHCATPRVVVLDINMPEINGIEVCRRMRNILGDDLPILFLTVSSNIEALFDCFQAGGNDFLIKTDNIVSIIHRIGFWVNRFAALQRNLQRPKILAMLEEQVAVSRQTANASDFDDLNDVPPYLHHFLTSARAHARTDYGNGQEQYRLFLGYVIGALDAALAEDFGRKPHFWTLLTECLRTTGALQNAQIRALLDEWDQTCQDEIVLNGMAVAREDWQNNLATPPIAPVGLAAILAGRS